MPSMHEVDYEILGDDMQFVKIELDPGEAVVAEAGAMMYVEDGIYLETIFGDGSAQQKGLMGALMGAGKRLLTGESIFMTVFQNQGQVKRKAVFAAPYPGKIVPMNLRDLGGEMELWLGDEKYLLTKSCLVYAPRGLRHCPMIARKVNRPFIHFTAGNGTEYAKKSI